MRTVTFHGPAGRLSAYGQLLNQGESGLFSDEEADLLAAYPHVNVTVADIDAPKRHGKHAASVEAVGDSETTKEES